MTCLEVPGDSLSGAIRCLSRSDRSEQFERASRIRNARLAQHSSLPFWADLTGCGTMSSEALESSVPSPAATFSHNLNRPEKDVWHASISFSPHLMLLDPASCISVRADVKPEALPSSAPAIL